MLGVAAGGGQVMVCACVSAPGAAEGIWDGPSSGGIGASKGGLLSMTNRPSALETDCRRRIAIDSRWNAWDVQYPRCGIM